MPMPKSTEDVVLASLKESFPDDTDLNPVTETPADDEPADASADDTEGDAAGDGSDASVDDASDADTDGDGAAGDDAGESELDDVEKELAALGIPKPEKGKDNRMPYSRQKKIFENAKKKWIEAHTKELSTRDERIRQFEGQEANWKTLSDLARTDAEGFIAAISAMNPQFREFRRQQAERVDPSAADPKPEADIKLQDGTYTYSQQQWERYNDWRDRQIEKRIRGEYEGRLKPFDEERRTREAASANEDRLRFMRQQIGQAEELWGKDLIDKHQNDIREVISQNPGISFHAAVSKVLLPLERAGKLETADKVRAKALKELDEAPAGSTQRPGGRKSQTKPVENMTTAEVVEQAIRDAGLIA